jgi:hypothetical protein
MNLTYVPLFQVQRDLYQLPRGYMRFSEYLRTMVDPETGDLKLPLVAMNPMGKDHLGVYLDALLAADADSAAARILVEVEARLCDRPGDYSVTTVVSDDLLGGWTNRTTTDFDYRFRGRAYHRRGWAVAILWSSEEPAVERVREEVQSTLFRLAHIQQHGYPVTLGEMLAQESYAMRMARATGPILEADDLAYTRAVIAPLLGTDNYAVQLSALYGDEAARELGYTPLGLSKHAGLALAYANREPTR